MALIDQVSAILTRLSAHGWKDLLLEHGLDITAGDLTAEMQKTLTIRRNLPGFEEFAVDATKGIQAGDPARSLLYHALACPAVNALPDGTPLGEFPTRAELDIIENWVYGINPPSFDDVVQRSPGSFVAVVVFSREYRQKSGTVHGTHADMVFSRTGVARVGNQVAAWNGSTRSFEPLSTGDGPHNIRALPCDYAVYIAARLDGDESNFGPFRANRAHAAEQAMGRSLAQPRDEHRRFWVPLHKLFPGDECLLGETIQLDLSAHHLNDKLRRIHLENMGNPGSGFDSGFDTPEIDTTPFSVSTGLVDLINQGSSISISPIAQPLIAATEKNGTPIGTQVPPQSGGLLPSFTIHANRRARNAPEYVHVRTRLKSNGTEEDLNETQAVAARVGQGQFRARHYSDFTADGWVRASIGGTLASRLSRSVDAYSIVAAPDFYPYVSQSELVDWTISEVPSNFRQELWAIPPLTLADERRPPNLALTSLGASFIASDDTATALVGTFGSASPTMSTTSSIQVNRVTQLCDGAAGVFAPGWDTSLDRDPATSTLHLAAHGLGSPFPEDAKLCAALSAFWPAVAPDSSRSSPGRPPIAPLTDSEIGLGTAPAWDGIEGPRIVIKNNRRFIEYDNFDHVDYVMSGLNGLFSLKETSKVTSREYKARILATHRLFRASRDELAPSQSIRSFASAWNMPTFEKADPVMPLLLEAQNATRQLNGPIYHFVLAQIDSQSNPFRSPHNRARWLIHRRIAAEMDAFVGSDGWVLLRRPDQAWTELNAG